MLENTRNNIGYFDYQLWIYSLKPLQSEMKWILSVFCGLTIILFSILRYIPYKSNKTIFSAEISEKVLE